MQGDSSLLAIRQIELTIHRAMLKLADTVLLLINPSPSNVKVHMFGQGHKLLRNLHQIFDWQDIGQIIGGDFAKLFGLLRIYELCQLIRLAQSVLQRTWSPLYNKF